MIDDIFDSLDSLACLSARPFIALIKGFQKIRMSPTRLRIDELPWSFWACRNRTRIPLLFGVRTCLGKALATVREIRNNNEGDSIGDISNVNSPISFFTEVPSVSLQLEDLHLSFHSVTDTADAFFYHDDEGIDVTEVFKRLTWPRVTNLPMHVCCASRESFVGFMERLTSSLRNLRQIT